MDFAILYAHKALSHPLGQFIGFVGIVLGAIWPLFKDRTRIMLRRAGSHTSRKEVTA